jgi:5-methylcytosine-specific restriction endonuclease McrA
MTRGTAAEPTVPLAGLRAKIALVLGDYAVTTSATSRPERHALHNGRDRALKVTADGKGLAGHVGAVLLRKAADQAGLTVGLRAVLRKKGTSPRLPLRRYLRLQHARRIDRRRPRDRAALRCQDDPHQAATGCGSTRWASAC